MAEARRKFQISSYEHLFLPSVQDKRKKRRLIHYWPLNQLRSLCRAPFRAAPEALDKSRRGSAVPAGWLRQARALLICNENMCFIPSGCSFFFYLNLLFCLFLNTAISCWLSYSPKFPTFLWPFSPPAQKWVKVVESLNHWGWKISLRSSSPTIHYHTISHHGPQYHICAVLEPLWGQWLPSPLGRAHSSSWPEEKCFLIPILNSLDQLEAIPSPCCYYWA